MAIACTAMGDEEEGLDHLRKALAFSQSSGDESLYVQFGPPVRDLLEKLIEEGRQGKQQEESDLDRAKYIAYINKIQAAFRVSQENLGQEEMKITPPPLLIEPLTSREGEVLQLLAKGYSYRKIGDQLSVTENTVRTHIRGLYTKLGVHNRVKAITRASELGLN